MQLDYRERDNKLILMCSWRDYDDTALFEIFRQESYGQYVSDFSWNTVEKVRKCFPSIFMGFDLQRKAVLDGNVS